MWTLTITTEADRDLIHATLLKEAERREGVASRSSLELVVGSGPDGRIGKQRADAVRQYHQDVETLKSAARQIEQPPTPSVAGLTGITDVVSNLDTPSDPVNMRQMEAYTMADVSDATIDETPAGIRPTARRRKDRPVKYVEFPEPTTGDTP